MSEWHDCPAHAGWWWMKLGTEVEAVRVLKRRRSQFLVERCGWEGLLTPGEGALCGARYAMIVDEPTADDEVST